MPRTSEPRGHRPVAPFWERADASSAGVSSGCSVTWSSGFAVHDINIHALIVNNETVSLLSELSPKFCPSQLNQDNEMNPGEEQRSRRKEWSKEPRRVNLGKKNPWCPTTALEMGHLYYKWQIVLLWVPNSSHNHWVDVIPEYFKLNLGKSFIENSTIL